MAKTMFLTLKIVASHLFFVFLLLSVSVSFDHFRNVHPMLKEDSSSSSDSDEWDEDDLGKVTLLYDVIVSSLLTLRKTVCSSDSWCHSYRELNFQSLFCRSDLSTIIW